MEKPILDLDTMLSPNVRKALDELRQKTIEKHRNKVVKRITPNCFTGKANNPRKSSKKV